MRKFFFASAIAAAAMLCAAPAAQAGYSAIASGVNGTGWAVGFPTMDSARDAAVAMCRQLGGSCSVTTAEHDNWWFVAGHCNGAPYTAASPQSVARAIYVLNVKGAADGNTICTIDKAF